MIALSTSPINLSMLRKLNTWYTIADGNWSNPNIWVGNAKRKYSIPQPGDNVCVNNSVILDVNNLTVNNLSGAGDLIFGTSSKTLNISGELNMVGSLDMSNAAHQLLLYGYSNYIALFIPGTSGTVNYVSTSAYQSVMPATYQNLTISGTGTSQLIGDVIVNGNLILSGNPNTGAGGILELSNCSFTVYGTSTFNQPSLLSKNSNVGNTLFVGAVSANGGDNKRFNLSGNPNMEFRGGLSLNQNSQQSNLGTGLMSFTTNNQNLNGTSTFNFGANIFIGSGITLTITGNGINSFGTITGEDSSSTLNNNSQLYLFNNTLPMSTGGVFNYMNTTPSTIGFCCNGNLTIPLNTFYNLDIQGTGVKTLGANTTVNNNLTLENSGNLECSSYSLSVTGVTVANQPSLLSKNSNSGYLLFEGNVTGLGGDSKRFDFTGNPNIEFRNGFSLNQKASGNTLGTGVISFTTNNQNFAYTSGQTIVSNPILISGAITVVFSGPLSGGYFDLLNTVNGTISGSTWNNECYSKYENEQEPMQIGTLICNSISNTFEYGRSGNQDINPVTYLNLTLSTNGSKRLLGNVSVLDSYILSSPAILDSNGYALTNP
ncbi:hypothetical protein [Mucilaginibacter gotjawali]|uniref:Uncharacterized protein n=2 Tax=Mucilaginibacter gotjawali TaxID=1550579 RepID=A0A839SLD7_9SPHI|nr:hypothetical protein [Mucilaginibacter gotjawali]MBB3057267.1 hypothetical protein [Mucilaginibacter gotjawali]BAU52965.1 hypothetical protein MgSA37_01132 [Mucilaginibacter gotjawali]